MKKIKLHGLRANGKYALIDDEDYNLVSQYRWWSDGKYALHTKHIKVDSSGKQIQKKIWMHRLVMNTPDGMYTDHIDNNKLNNCKSNLRIVTLQQNNCNLPLRKTNKSGYKGVWWDKERNKWFAYIRYQKKMHALGRYVTKEEAAIAYNKAALTLHKEFARLNNV